MRIENTDTAARSQRRPSRSSARCPGSGIDWDGAVTFQLDRMDDAASSPEQLVAEGKAYEDEGAIRFRMPDEGVTAWDDVVLGRIEFPNEKLEDLVLVRSDGRPTYNFVSPLEDVLDGITHVIRGQDHVSNTPKQLRILRAIGAELPVYAHVPTSYGADGKKLSKRHGAIDRRRVPRATATCRTALMNFLALLGWSYDDETTIMSRASSSSASRSSGSATSPATFDYQKLDWLNGDLPARAAAGRVRGRASSRYLREQGYEWHEERDPGGGAARPGEDRDPRRVPGVRGLPLRARSSPIRRSSAAAQMLPAAVERLAEVEPFDGGAIEAALRDVAERLGLKPREAFQPIRLAVTGSTVSPGLFESLELLGRGRVPRSPRAGQRPRPARAGRAPAGTRNQARRRKKGVGEAAWGVVITTFR